jgi:hypothetical protein
MTITLKPEMFKNNKFSCFYGDKEALFTIVDEEFEGNNKLGKINRIVILVRDVSGSDVKMCTTIIGMGDGVVGIRSGNPAVRGKVLNKDNMEDCVIELYGDD